MTEQAGRGAIASEIDVFNQQVRGDDEVATGGLGNQGSIIADSGDYARGMLSRLSLFARSARSLMRSS